MKKITLSFLLFLSCYVYSQESSQESEMIIPDPDNYRFLRFQVSETKGKKYDAILQNLETKKERRVPFGDRDYGHYEDRALGVYSRLDHKDKKRRENYIKRHENDIHNKFSSGWFSRNYLW